MEKTQGNQMDNHAQKPFSFFNALKLAGTFIALVIGAGFATGQSSMQFFVSQGPKMFITMAIGYSLLVLVAQHLMKLGHDKGFSSPQDTFKYLLGEKIGSLFTWYAVFVMLLSYAVMIAGAAATISQVYGLSAYIGAAIMIMLVVLSVIFGLKRMVDIIGTLGPLISVFVIIITVVAFAKAPTSLGEALRLAESKELLTVSPNAILTGLLYCCLTLPSLVSVLPAIGNSVENRKEVAIGGVAGPVLYIITDMAVAIALVLFVASVADQMVPLLALSAVALPIVAPIFMYLIFAGIYTTATPMLWGVCARFAKDKTVKYKLIALIVGVVFGFGSLVLPFNKLVNIIYPTIGYSGMILLVAIIVRFIKSKKEDN